MSCRHIHVEILVVWEILAKVSRMVKMTPLGVYVDQKSLVFPGLSLSVLFSSSRFFSVFFSHPLLFLSLSSVSSSLSIMLAVLNIPSSSSASASSKTHNHHHRHHLVLLLSSSSLLATPSLSSSSFFGLEHSVITSDTIGSSVFAYCLVEIHSLSSSLCSIFISP